MTYCTKYLLHLIKLAKQQRFTNHVVRCSFTCQVPGQPSALLRLHICTLSPCSCGPGWGWRWVLYPIWMEKQFGPLKGWGFWSSSAKGSGKKVQCPVGHCLERSAGCCGRVVSECPAPGALLQSALASGEGAARVLTGCGVWSPVVGFLDSQWKTKHP